ncbi:MAG TPA: sigma 54-interacting transcriptional regulator [Terriglobales bacterium]|jgi:transcriptional regulator with GAF, ATPase, and Fis domain|nr:sigma 54-interacting transcriptional regulator [Terriglobales bacterium]
MKSAAQMKLVDGTTAVVRSEPMRKLMAMVERVAQHDAAVLIVGETGVGKEMVAKAIHQHSLRCGKAFVDVNCAALPEHLVESELFGYEKGAFSGADSAKPGLFELADQGTLLLDEIGELDGKVQAKLLRVLDGVPYYRLGGSRKVAVNVRVIAATNRDLEQEVRAGKFRSDLYHRLTQFLLQVPPLRERLDDIVAIAEFFLQQQAPAARFSEEAKEALLRYDWPGNVRELKNVIFKVALQAKPGTEEIRASHLPAAICGLPGRPCSATFEGNLNDMERQMIFQALAQNNNHQAKTAKQLGISSRTLRRKLQKYNRDAQGAQTPGLKGTVSALKQRYFRAMIELPIVLQVDGQSIETTSVNLSSGGLAIQCPSTLSHGSTMDISFTLPGATSPIEAKATLAWTAPGGLAGLSIVEIHPALERELQQWLAEKAKAEGEAESEHEH